jgi:hypothetical protein
VVAFPALLILCHLRVKLWQDRHTVSVPAVPCYSPQALASYLIWLVLFVADLFHPLRPPPVELFLDGNVSHGCGWPGRRANAFRLEVIRPRHRAEFLQPDLPVAARARNQPSRSGSDRAGGCAMIVAFCFPLD